MGVKTAPVAVEDDEGYTELDRVIAWRANRLLRLGFTWEQAAVLCRRNDVEHEAEALLARGAPHTYVVEELT